MGKTPSCKDFRLMADEYIEGELTSAEMREFEAHIAECEECRREVEELRALKAFLRSNREEVPEGLHSRIMDAVNTEPKPKKKPLLLRRASLSAACFFICLSITLIIAMLPMWQPNKEGGAGLPNDPLFNECETKKEELSSSIAVKPEKDEAQTAAPEEVLPETEKVMNADGSEITIVPECAPSGTAEAETMVIAETTMIPAEEITEAAEITAVPETIARPETAAPETEVAVNTKGNALEAPTYDAAPEASSAPGGEEITLALLVVSGLLAVASFIAFLISLSSIRNKPINKGDQK